MNTYHRDNFKNKRTLHSQAACTAFLFNHTKINFMKQKLLLFSCALAAVIIVAFSSCGPKCKKCHTEVMGISSPAQELCGEQLEQAMKTPGVKCE